LTLFLNGRKLDRATFNVFTMNGALDVPGNGTYTYTADVSGGKWLV